MPTLLRFRLYNWFDLRHITSTFGCNGSDLILIDHNPHNLHTDLSFSAIQLFLNVYQPCISLLYILGKTKFIIWLTNFWDVPILNFC